MLFYKRNITIDWINDEIIVVEEVNRKEAKEYIKTFNSNKCKIEEINKVIEQNYLISDMHYNRKYKKLYAKLKKA